MAEIRVDRYKMLNLVRRPDPIGARNIGNWWVIFNGISVIAIFTNVGLLCFTLRTFNDWPIFNYNTYLTFAVIVTFLLLFRTWLNGFIKQIPKNYRILLKRHKHLKNKVMQNNPELQRKSRIGGFVTGQELIEVDTLGNTVSSEWLTKLGYHHLMLLVALQLKDAHNLLLCRQRHLFIFTPHGLLLKFALLVCHWNIWI